MNEVRPSDVAVLVPCYNEAPTVARVVADFHAALPGCRVYVYDNRSTDGTGDIARAAGAIVRREQRPGKGGVMRRMFADIDASVYVVCDGDATYDAARAPEMIAQLAAENLDMVTGVRDHEGRSNAYRRGHQFGNRAFNWLLGVLFGERPRDVFSGYRVFSRRFVKSFPSESRGFEIETEIAVHALEMRVPCAEVVTRYAERPEGSASKLDTYRDGFRILATMARLFRDIRPLPFFSLCSGCVRAGGRNPRRGGRRRVFADRSGAPVANGGPRDRIDVAGITVGCLRIDPRQRGPRAARGQAPGLPRGCERLRERLALARRRFDSGRPQGE